MTFLEIKTEVEGNIIDLPAFVTNSVPALVNAALVDIQVDHNFKVMEATLEDQLTTVSDTTLVAAPDRFKEFRGRPYYVQNTGDVRYLDYSPDKSSVLTLFPRDKTDRPRVLTLSDPIDENLAMNLEVYPIPDGLSDYLDGEYRITIPYWRYVTPLASDSAVNWFTANADRYLVERATSLGFAKDHNYEAMALWAETAEKWRLKAIKRDKLLRLSGVETLIPRWEGVNTPRAGNNG